MNGQGVLYAAYGPHHMVYAACSLSQLRNTYAGPVAVIGHDERLALVCQEHGAAYVEWPLDKVGPLASQWPQGIKPHLCRLSPFQHTAYLDADTIPVNPCVESMWDLVEVNPMWVRYEQGEDGVQELNSGVMAWGRSPDVEALFADWANDWHRQGHLGGYHDEPSLHRAIVRGGSWVGRLPHPWNVYERELERKGPGSAISSWALMDSNTRIYHPWDKTDIVLHSMLKRPYSRYRELFGLPRLEEGTWHKREQES